MSKEGKPSVVEHKRLTHEGAARIIAAAIAKADTMGVPQCIAVVDDGGNLLAFMRMDGARFLSIESSINKAVTAASGRAQTGNVPADVDMKLAVTTGGKLVNLKGGVPIVVDGKVIGGIGVGSGTGDQDLEVAKAGLAAVSG
ncbi:MAG TPA: heme-binding protein [Stellaceae bacterium]|nr:heme-binding protein [Stellaceae bacterium]